MACAKSADTIKLLLMQDKNKSLNCLDSGIAFVKILISKSYMKLELAPWTELDPIYSWSNQARILIF